MATAHIILSMVIKQQEYGIKMLWSMNQTNDCLYSIFDSLINVDNYLEKKGQNKSQQYFMYLLFCYSLISLSVTDQFNQEWLLVPSDVQGPINKYIKNANIIRLLHKQMVRLNVKGILYTIKPKHLYQNIIFAIDPDILNNWIFIEEDNKKFPGITPNRAFLSKQGNICFGEGFQHFSIKNKLRLAVCSALKIDKSDIIILEGKKEEAEYTKKENFPYVYSQIISLEQLSRIIEEMHKNRNKPEQIQLKEEQMHQINEIYEGIKYNYNKIQMFSFQSVCRTPKSKSISSIILKNIFNNKFYIAKTDRTIEYGGDLYAESLQNIKLFSQFSNFCQVNMLSHFTILLNTKYSLIPSYDKKKAKYLVKPFVKKLQVLNNSIKTEENFYFLMKEGKLGQKKVKDLGKHILISLICFQNTSKKSLFEMLGYIENQDQINLIRFDGNSLFDMQNIKNHQINRLSQRYWSFSLRQVSPSIYEEMQELYGKIQQKISFIKGLFYSYKWQFNKKKLYQLFQERMHFIKDFFKFNKEVKLKINPLDFNLTINDDFDWFTKKHQPNQFFSEKRQNQFTELMKNKKSFQIYSTIPQIVKFLKWISYKWGQVQYMSLLVNNQLTFQNLLKKLKQQSQIDKKPRILVVDHCETNKGIQSLHRSIRTIFISRFHKINEQSLATIAQSQFQNGQLQNTNEELFQTIINKRILTYQTYLETLISWISNKAMMYSINIESSIKKCYQTYNAIIKNLNRINQLQSPQLYTLPVYKSKQKIYFIHDIQNFLSFHYLVRDILEQKWNGKLQSNQFDNFKNWIQKSSLKKQITFKIKNYVNQNMLSEFKNDSLKIFEYLSPQNYLRNLLQYNYSEIVQIVGGDKIYTVHTKDNLFIYDYSFQVAKKIEGIKTTFHKVNIKNNQVLLQRLNFNKQNQPDQIECSILDQFFVETSKWVQRYIKSYNYVFVNQKLIACWKDNKMNFNGNQFNFNQTIINAYFNQKQQLLVCTENKLLLFQNQQYITIFQFQTQMEKAQMYCFAQNQCSFITLIARQRKMLALINLNQNTIQYKTNTNIIACLCINISRKSMFMMQRDSKILYEYHLETLLQKQKYFEVQQNAKKIISFGFCLVIQGGFYVKKIKLN